MFYVRKRRKSAGDMDLTVGDISFFPNKATVKLIGKDKKVRMISIPADAAAILKGYIKYRKI